MSEVRDCRDGETEDIEQRGRRKRIRSWPDNYEQVWVRDSRLLIMSWA